MKPLDYQSARRVVSTFNVTRCVRETARVLKLPVDLVRRMTDWLWNRTFQKETAVVAKLTELSRIKISEETWCEFLYTDGVSPEDAAESLGWSVEAVLASCKGESEWRKTTGRKRLTTRNCAADTQPQKGDPSEEEIYEAAAALRKTWSPTDARHGERRRPVEAREYIFDGHNQQVFRLS